MIELLVLFYTAVIGGVVALSGFGLLWLLSSTTVAATFFYVLGYIVHMGLKGWIAL